MTKKGGLLKQILPGFVQAKSTKKKDSVDFNKVVCKKEININYTRYVSFNKHYSQGF
jgi:hypothetical protein